MSFNKKKLKFKEILSEGHTARKQGRFSLNPNLFDTRIHLLFNILFFIKSLCENMINLINLKVNLSI